MRMNSRRNQLLSLAGDIEGGKRRDRLSRRRVLTIIGAVAGLPLLPGVDQPANAARLYRWQGTSLGSPSCILLNHSDRGAAEHTVAHCVAEIERLEKQFSLYRNDRPPQADGRVGRPRPSRLHHRDSDIHDP